MNEINVTIPLETVNAAIQALAKMPYEFSANHIALLQQRGNEAINAMNAANAAKQAAEAAAKESLAKAEVPKAEPAKTAGDAA
jgi:hypothetical protein